MSFLEKIQQCNEFDASQFFDFVIEDHRVGYISKNKSDDLFKNESIIPFEEDKITLCPDLTTYEKRTHAMETVITFLQEKRLISKWGDEFYPVSYTFDQKPYFSIPRCAATFFGVKTYGTHLNAYIRKEGKIFVWIAKRASHLKFLPNKLDTFAAGGLPLWIEPEKNMIKEAMEEANLSQEALSKMVAVGAVSYLLQTKQGASPDTMFVYDIEFSPDFIPVPNKEEIENFTLYSIDELYQLVRDTDCFKYNSALVIIDFLIRHSAITPHDKNYLEIIHQLRQPNLFNI
jgi:8-oxo-dGTP pyrophosphatase MutT (NUDIX family)